LHHYIPLRALGPELGGVIQYRLCFFKPLAEEPPAAIADGIGIAFAAGVPGIAGVRLGERDSRRNGFGLGGNPSLQPSQVIVPVFLSRVHTLLRLLPAAVYLVQFPPSARESGFLRSGRACDTVELIKVLLPEQIGQGTSIVPEPIH